jgi:outer membrane biosynthesis protein TonB
MQSKILEYLEISSEVSDKFPEDIKEFVVLIDGSQDIYAESKDSSKKEKLADLIVGWVRQLMEYLMTQNLGLYANQNVKLEQQTLPQMPTQEEQPQEPNPQEPQDEPQEPNEEPEDEPQEPQDEPQPNEEPEEEVLTIDEQQEIVDGLRILAKIDSSFKDELKIEMAKLKALKKNS